MTGTATLPAPLLDPSPAAARRPALLRTDTPGRMRAWSVVVAVLAVLFGIVGSTAVANRSTDLGEARDAAAQLERLESVRTAVVEADSLAASAYLEAGLESPERRATYEERVASAQSGLIAAAADATPAEAERLADVSSALTTMGGLVEQSRANSRQGYPVGAAYQRNASALVRSDVLPVLDSVAAATAARTVAEVDTGLRPQLLLWGSAIVALLAVGGASSFLQRRTRRMVNIGLAVGTLVVFGSTAVASVSLASAGSSASDTIDGSYAGATAFAQARTAAFDAKSNEALTLIARGNGASFEARWVQQADQASSQLGVALGVDTANGPTARDAFDQYRVQHEAIRSLDDNGEYDEAVQRALTIGTPDDAFDRFDSASSTGLASLSAETDTSLADASDSVATQRWIVLIAGLVAAAAAFVGIGRRIQEYR